jgi:hypothetical protein
VEFCQSGGRAAELLARGRRRRLGEGEVAARGAKFFQAFCQVFLQIFACFVKFFQRFFWRFCGISRGYETCKPILNDSNFFARQPPKIGQRPPVPALRQRRSLLMTE